MKDLSIAGQRSAEHDEPIVDEGVHEVSVLSPAQLLAQISRPIPRTAALESHYEVHGRHVTPSTRWVRSTAGPDLRITGTHQGELMGIAATGRSIDVQLIDIIRFGDDGLAHEHWGVIDSMTMMQQLGVVPAGPPA
jgi:hypothetical protein